MFTPARMTQVSRFLLFFAVYLAAGTANPVFSQIPAISGTILLPDGTPVEEVQVAITGFVGSTQIGPLYDLTDANGVYSIPVPIGGTYTVTPAKDNDPLNGVSSFDLVMISRHVLGIEPFSTPFQYIAADANHSGTVGLDDSLELRQLILGIYTQLPNSPSWRFVPTNYIFPADPLNPPYPESVTITDFQANNTGVDFFGVKIGDINNTAFIFSESLIYGVARLDSNNDCTPESGEEALAGWTVEASDGANLYTATIRPNGTYYLPLPAGTYDVHLNKPNGLWSICTDTVFGVTVQNTQSASVTFSAEFLAQCPYPTVDLSAPFLRRCFASTYNVHYCNLGTETANDAYVDVALDTFLQLTGASLPYTSLGGNSFRFELGDLPAPDCGDFTLNVYVSCEAVLGQTHCSSAHIYPDSLCGPLAYSGPELDVQGECDGDNVIFTITNTGDDMLAPACYVVIEDVMVQMTGNCIQLNNNESETITVPANGSTWRLEIEQAAGYPWSGVASATAEGCGTNGSGTFSLGFVTQFPNDEAEPWVDVDCQENIGAYDPNDKQGFPTGIGAAHYVPKDQEIEYLIRFQNTGTDTAFNIIVRDTLSPLFDFATLRPGGSSYPYTLNLTGPGVLEFVFANIMLPDSNVNEPASHGYVKFALRPRAGLADGTVVENDAAIFFDYNAPVITNKTLHTLGEQYLSVRPTVFAPGLELDVFPNPSVSIATFRLKSAVPHNGILRVFDSRGRQVQSMTFGNNQFEFNAEPLPAGLYFFRIDDAQGQPLAGGRLVVQK